MKRPSATAASAASATARARLGHLRTPLLGRGEHGARERDDRARRAASADGRSPVASEIVNGTSAPQATSGETMLIVPSESAL